METVCVVEISQLTVNNFLSDQVHCNMESDEEEILQSENESFEESEEDVPPATQIPQATIVNTPLNRANDIISLTNSSNNNHILKRNFSQISPGTDHIEDENDEDITTSMRRSTKKQKFVCQIGSEKKSWPILFHFYKNRPQTIPTSMMIS